MDEQALLDELRRIEAKLQTLRPDSTPSEAQATYDRLKQRSAAQEHGEPTVEMKFSFHSMWSKRLFLALAGRHGLRPYRYRGQRHTTAVLKVSRSFVDEVLWPEFERADGILARYLSEVTDLFIEQVISDDQQQTTVQTQKIRLPAHDAPPVIEGRAVASSQPDAADVAESTSSDISTAAASPTSGDPPHPPGRSAAARRKKNRKRRRKRR